MTLLRIALALAFGLVSWADGGKARQASLQRQRARSTFGGWCTKDMCCR